MTTRDLFDRIVGRYDLLNRILSLGREQSWRRSALRHLPDGPMLDLGAGTGVAQPLFGDRPVVALDPALEMLRRNPTPFRVVAVGEALPFRDESFSGVFSSYVFRNLDSLPRTLEEVRRVLVPGGRLGVVDLGRPVHPILRALHRVGTAVLLPLAGWTVGARREYAYLHRSLDKYPQPEELFADAPLEVERTWRMGPLGFVYGALLEKR